MKSSQALWISYPIFQRMIDEAEKWAPYETGGVLMGYQAQNNDLVVTDLIGAGDNATHKYTGFTPDQDYQLEQIAQVYVRSGGTITYLGDWHTHPNSKPEPSLLDKRTLTRIALTPESKNIRPIMAILGGSPTRWTLNSIQFLSGALRPWPFSKCFYSKIEYEIYSE
jgi:integrative and conjugative element protein (TIGR02256 family)